LASCADALPAASTTPAAAPAINSFLICICTTP
jgi:hypothetical protein